MFRVISIFLLLSGPVYAQTPSHCALDGSLLPHNERAIKMLALHYANRSTPLVDIKKQADQVNITYTKPACGSDGLPIPWDQLNVVINPK